MNTARSVLTTPGAADKGETWRVVQEIGDREGRTSASVLREAVHMLCEARHPDLSARVPLIGAVSRLAAENARLRAEIERLRAAGAA